MNWNNCQVIGFFQNSHDTGTTHWIIPAWLDVLG